MRRLSQPCERSDDRAVTSDERLLWHAGQWCCVMVSCCAGAELQLRHGAADDYEILIRELYPAKADVYERAAALREEYASRLV